jgi:hypothetical protein
MIIETRLQLFERLLSRVNIPAHFAIGVNKKWFTFFTLLISRPSSRIVVVLLGFSFAYNYKTKKFRRNRKPKR